MALQRCKLRAWGSHSRELDMVVLDGGQHVTWFHVSKVLLRQIITCLIETYTMLFASSDCIVLIHVILLNRFASVSTFRICPRQHTFDDVLFGLLPFLDLLELVEKEIRIVLV